MKKLDEIDLRILTILFADADITNKELAGQIGIAPSTCLERVKRMKQSGVIKNAFVDINFKTLGGNIEAIAAIRLQPYSEEIVNQLRDDLLKLPEIVSLYHMGGNYDYFIHMSVKDSEHLRRFVFEAITSRDEVQTVETSLVFEHSRSGVLPNFSEE
ncbi:Lrp/AsnC family transcriptional regulator [Thalassotalea sp. LPB0316]|uniref:Lrp/AsnC family transcriptional regulator n=1 Tax=Thalassotalea sp. LPB0316 TaxID=2769490 RepID=UPI0018678783|nr:Lrp/AsnC family transcriptional regulator [Thalassotalea sp. LPB0316]QOL25289.1 Lrp/AsnC family transcriptional regulator [Thalassotalea sp. LPB0316]